MRFLITLTLIFSTWILVFILIWKQILIHTQIELILMRLLYACSRFDDEAKLNWLMSN